MNLENEISKSEFRELLKLTSQGFVTSSNNINPFSTKCFTYVETRSLVFTSKMFEKHLVDDLHLYLKCHSSARVFQTFC